VPELQERKLFVKGCRMFSSARQVHFGDLGASCRACPLSFLCLAGEEFSVERCEFCGEYYRVRDHQGNPVAKKGSIPCAGRLPTFALGHGANRCQFWGGNEKSCRRREQARRKAKRHDGRKLLGCITDRFYPGTDQPKKGYQRMRQA
jgi:hypothetical protein